MQISVEADDSAVSPVIGVILMVSITVILATVIGTFGIEVGDQEETAPNTSFDSEQKTEYFDRYLGTLPSLSYN
jgi:flagellin-like protein